MKNNSLLSTTTTLIVAVLLCVCSNALAQRMYSLGGASVLQVIDIQTRNVTDIVTVSPSLSDIAFHPDGTLYGVNEHSIYRIDTTSGNATVVATLPASYGWLVGMAVDYQGRFYISALGGGTDHLLRYELSSGALEDLGSVGYSHWDLEFYNGELYLTGGTDQTDQGFLIQANLMDLSMSRILMDYKVQAYGLASFNDPCEGHQLIAPVPDSMKILDPVTETFITGAIDDEDYSVSAGATSPTGYLGSLPAFAVALEATSPVPCDGNGTVDLFANIPDPRPGIQYSINGTDFQDTAFFNGMEPGTYSITLRDSFGCTFTSDPFNFGTFDPDVSFDTKPAHCNKNNGSIEVSFQTTDSLLFSIDGTTWQGQGSFSQLAPGTYQLSIRNGIDCEEIHEIIIEEIPALTHAFNTSPEYCDRMDGTIEVLAEGGEGPYSYSLVALPDQSSPVFNNLHSGTYSVRTTDALGCKVQNGVVIDSVDGPVIEEIIIDDAHCGQSDGSAVIIASGTGDLTFIVGGNVSSGNTIENLSDGAYTIQVEDAVGCVSNSSFAVSSLDGPSINSITTTNDNCFSPAGTIEIDASSTNSSLSYSIDGSNFTQQSFFPNITAGDYMIFVRDEFNCDAIEPITVDMDPAPEITNIQITPATCDLDNASIAITPNFTAGVEFSIDGANWSGQTEFAGLSDGIYTITAIDANACTDTEVIEVTRITPLKIESVVTTEASCLGNDGMIEVLLDSLDNNATFALNNGSFNAVPIFSGLTPEAYTVHLKDENGCIDSMLTNVDQVEGIIIRDIAVEEADCGKENGTIRIDAENALEIDFESGELTFTGEINDLAGGIYTIAILGDHHCRLDTIIEVPEVGCDLFMPNVFTPNGDGTNELLAPQYDPAKVDITSFDIFDRWGNLVFSCPDGCPWDGTMGGEYVPAGVYIYYVRSQSKSGVTVNQTGDVTVLY